MKKLLMMIVASAIALATALPSFAADWTDANGNEYTALKSLKTSGNQWILINDFDISCTDIVKMKFTSTKSDSCQGLWCSRMTGNTQFSAFYSVDANKKISFYRKSTYIAHSKVINAGEDCSVVANYGTREFTVNGTSQTLSGTNFNGDYTDIGAVMLFATYTAGKPTGTTGNKAFYDLYYYEFCDSASNLKHCLMPAKNASGVAGLYDTVGRKFYGPTSGTFNSTEWGSDRAGKKWTGLGGDNKMSNDDNWEGGVAPVTGDDLDFTIAVPFAAIDADIDATFGKVYLGTGDIPAFIGSLTATAVNDLTRMQAYDAATAGFTFTLEAPTGQDFTWNGGASANWWATDVWTYNSAASLWYDINNAIFNTANATATLDAHATAASVAFNAPATIDGAATLTVPTVSVASGVSATISAPTAGALEKTGAGTLALTQSRTAATTVTAGTLKMDGATLSNFTLGTDGGAPVVFDYGGQELRKNPADYLVTGSDVTLTNGTFWMSGAMSIRDNTKIPAVLTIAKDATLGQTGDDDKFIIDKDNGTATVNVVGGTFGKTSGNNYGYIQHASSIGRLNINVTDGGLLTFSSSSSSYPLSALCGGNEGDTPSLYMMFSNATFYVAHTFKFGNSANSYGVSTAPTGVFAATNSTITVADTFAIGRNLRDTKTGGSYTFDFEDCVVTTRYFGVYHDRPLNNVRFNGTRFVFRAASGSIAASDGADNWITVGNDGLTLDTQAYACSLNANLGGSGAVTKVGTGTLTVASNQTASAAFNVNEGTLAVNGGVSISRPIAVASGAKLQVNATDTASIDTLVLEAGSTLNIASYDGHTPLAPSSLTLPAEGAVNLTLNGGAFARGVYSIYSKSGVTAAEGGKFTFTTADKLVGNWSVDGDTLILTVGEVSGNFWTGRGGDGRMSTAANWLNGVPAAGADIDFSGIPNNTTIIADADRTFGNVTLGSSVITFTNAMAAASYTDTSKVVVAADSTVTVEGDLVFYGSEAEYIVNSVAADGAFRVTGRIVADSSKTGNLYPCVSVSIAGTIEANGLVHNGNGGGFWLARNQDDAHASWAIGADGISGTKLMGYTSNEHIHNFSASITATADFTVTTPIVNRRTLTLNPAGHVITLGTNTATSAGAIIGGSNASNVIAGRGKVVANYTIGTYSKNNPFTIKTGATLELIPGVALGTGLVTVQNAGTLGVAESGTVTLGGDLTLDDGATLAFNFTPRANPPVLALDTGKSVIFTEGASTNIAVKVSGTHPRGGEKILTTCGGFNTDGVNVSLVEDVPNWVNGLSVNDDGNLVLDVKPRGLIISVQ